MNHEVRDLALERLRMSLFGSKWYRRIGGTGRWCNHVIDGFSMGLNDGAGRGHLLTGDGEVLGSIGCPIFDGEFG